MLPRSTAGWARWPTPRSREWGCAARLGNACMCGCAFHAPAVQHAAAGHGRGGPRSATEAPACIGCTHLSTRSARLCTPSRLHDALHPDGAMPSCPPPRCSAARPGCGPPSRHSSRRRQAAKRRQRRGGSWRSSCRWAGPARIACIIMGRLLGAGTGMQTAAAVCISSFQRAGVHLGRFLSSEREPRVVALQGLRLCSAFHAVQLPAL